MRTEEEARNIGRRILNYHTLHPSRPTQQGMAEMVGMSGSTICAIEAYARDASKPRPSEETFDRAERLLAMLENPKDEEAGGTPSVAEEAPVETDDLADTIRKLEGRIALLEDRVHHSTSHTHTLRMLMDAPLDRLQADAVKRGMHVGVLPMPSSSVTALAYFILGTIVAGPEEA